MSDIQNQWFPIAASSDTPFRHVYQAKLHGREMAVWRADDNNVNAWENRCLHRGVRLSIGINDGAELKCQYHGWRYANRTGGCTYIPAHPVDSPARTICASTFPAIERYGLIWSNYAAESELAVIDELVGQNVLTLRSIAVNAPADETMKALVGHRFNPSANLTASDADIAIASRGDYSCKVTATLGADTALLFLFVQPVDSKRSVIHGVLSDTSLVIADEQQRMAALQHHNERMCELRNVAEAAMASDISGEYSPNIIASTANAEAIANTFTVLVAKKWMTAEGIAAFRFESSTGEQLPTAQPGAHIDVHMPNGLVRQYSITNGPGESDHYTIAVKLEAKSTGGSECMHLKVQEGDRLTISAPRNNFPLRRDALNTILLAGGIGITPMLSMARTLHKNGLPFELHYFSQGQEHVAFPDLIAQMGDSVHRHFGLSPAETGDCFQRLLAEWQPENHLYVCGPGPMLEAARSLADNCGWPDKYVHFEYFKNTTEIDDSSTFEIALARSDMTLTVPSGSSIIDVLRENGINVATSCEQGACGTCKTTVLEGIPDHQDVFLSNSEKESGQCIMTCVSRAKTKRLVLDI